MKKSAILISGATSGIGLECVEQFLATSDLAVIAVGRNHQTLDRLSSNERLVPKVCDIRDEAAVQNLVNNLELEYNFLGLINAAGITARGDNTQDEHAAGSEVIAVNVQGLTTLVECVLPSMRRQRCGTIINLSSLADRYPRPTNAVYAASKAYVKSFSDSLRLQNAKYNIRVINFAPALVATPMVTDKLGISEGLISVYDSVKLLKILFDLPSELCVRDIVLAPTSYEG